MKIFTVILLCIFMTSCGYYDRITTYWTGDLTYKCSKHGVEYVQADSGLAVSVNRLGVPVGCK